MPQIFDNIELTLLRGLHVVFPQATAGSFCVGYLNLRGWGQVADLGIGIRRNVLDHTGLDLPADQAIVWATSERNYVNREVKECS
jgi:hypothetical protein